MKQNFLKPFFGILIFVIIPLWGFGQYFIWGQDPGSLKWKQIRTDNFQVIFPEGYEEQGAYITSALELAYEYGSRTLGHRPRRVSVILHNQTIVPNGFVSWAPRRLEMFTNPPQNNYAHDWLEQLAVHEFRHVVQVDKLNQGITKVISLIMGEQGTGAVFGLLMPMWFVEGDAVAVETGLSNSGRGSLPAFEQGLRAQVLEKGLYSYDKAFFGSFKDYVPNYYELGYQLVAAGRVEYGEDIWEKVVTNVARRPYTIRPFSLGLKKHAGVTSVQHYRNTFEKLDSAWHEQGRNYHFSQSTVFNKENKLYTNYRYPSFANDTTLVALKTGMREIPRVVVFDKDGNEKVLFSPGFVNAHGFSAGAGKVVWSEQRTDPRWEHRSWSEVHIYDLETGKRRQLTRRTRYFAPAISPNGQMITVAEVTDQNRYALVVISAEDGREITRLETLENDFLMTPSWHPDNRTIAAVALNETGKAIVFGDIYTQDFKQVFHAGFVEISRPQFTPDGKLLFTGTFSGLEKVYLLDAANNSVVQLIASPFGARDAVSASDGETIFWSDYTSDGYVIATSQDNVFSGAILLEKVEDHSLKLHEIMRQQEGALVTRSNIIKHLSDNEEEMEVLPYFKFPGLFNLHSWSPMYIDANNMEARPGAAVYFQDVLSTSVAVLGYDFDLNEQLGTFSIDYKYYGWYPVLNLNSGTGLRRGAYRQGDAIREFLYRENTFRVGLNLPLRFRQYEWLYGVTPIVNTAVTKVRATDSSPSFFRPNEMRSMEYRVFAFRQQRSAARDIRPRWANVVDVNYRHTPFKGTDMGSVFSARVIGFFPGLARHHSLRLSGAWQERKKLPRPPNTITYLFPNLIPYPRGISGRSDDQVLVLSADYALPLMYPDLSLPPFLYLKRISANLFIDRADTRTLVKPEEGDPFQAKDVLYSTGVEITGNMHLVRFISPIDLGLRIYYLPETKKTGFTMLYGISF